MANMAPQTQGRATGRRPLAGGGQADGPAR